MVLSPPFLFLGLLQAYAVTASWDTEQPSLENAIEHDQRAEDSFMRDMIMIRTYQPTDIMLQRMKKIQIDNPHREILIAVDTTNVNTSSLLLPSSSSSSTAIINTKDDPAEWTKRRQKDTEDRRAAISKAIAMFGKRVVIYTQQDVYSIFPGMKNLGGIVTLSYHDHCIYTVVKAWERRNGKSFAGHLWVLEDDVEFTASWSRLFDKYREYDFVAHRFSTYDRNWQKNHQYFGKQISPKFRSEFLMGLGYQSYVFILEHVVKYSPAFLAKVFELLENGYHARSEIGTGTFATRLNFTYYNK
eukprot:jgi/Bigna1/82899/fgenesh1_pg.99_\